MVTDSLKAAAWDRLAADLGEAAELTSFGSSIAFTVSAVRNSMAEHLAQCAKEQGAAL